MERTIFVKIFSIFFIFQNVLGSTKNLTTDADYGKTWIYFPDGNNNPQIAYLTKDPNQNLRTSLQEIMTKVKFHLHRRSQRKPRKIELGASDNLLKHFDLNLDVKLLIHGWKSSDLSPSIGKTKNSYFLIRDINIVTVNWGELAESTFYLTVASQTKHVGEVVAELINELVSRGIHFNQIHLIGHSLGAHVCGYAGRLFDGKIKRITGLDPAGPGFEIFNIFGLTGLSKKDAKFVDVIHTSAGLEGFKKAIGHADFYPNNGEPPQPGCEDISNLINGCSHGRSAELFAESITTKVGFYSYPCENYETFTDGLCQDHGVLMGDRILTSTKGVFYLETTNREGKYAKGPI